MVKTWPRILEEARQVKWETLEPGYQKLLDEPLTKANLESWLDSWSDAECVYVETYMALMRAKDENSLDEEAQQAFLTYVSDVLPQIEAANQKLKLKVLPFAKEVETFNLKQVVKIWQNEADLFREENLPLQSKIQELASEFSKLTGSLSVTFQGKTMTISEAETLLLEPDRDLREKIWQAIASTRQDIQKNLDDLFLELLNLRRKLAKNASEKDFRAFQWRTLNRFDYSPEDGLKLHDVIRKECLPLVREHYAKKVKNLGIEQLRPWDVKVDALSRSPLKPFESHEELETGLVRIFSSLDPLLGAQFNAMRNEWLDLENRQGKVPGMGYCAYLPRSGQVYIYHSVTATHDDLWIMLHEAGHAFHALAAMQQKYFWNYHAGPEFSEVASQAMELISIPYWTQSKGGFYAEEDALRAKELEIMQFLNRFLSTAKYDALQHWLYTEAPEDLSAQDIDQKWLELSEQFDYGLDWSALEHIQAKEWQVVHLYHFPFYMLDYAIAMLGAVEIWRNAMQDQEKALHQYREALALGNTRPMPELFEAAGATFSFAHEHVAGLMQFLAEQLEL